MTRINLLPWRAERRARRQKDFLAMLGLSAVAGLLLAFLINWYYGQQISGQNERNAYLQDQIAQVDKQIEQIKELDKERADLLQRKKVIEELQSNRSRMVHLFDALVRTIPEGVMLTGLRQEGDKLTLMGRAQSNARVSAYMRNLEGSGWMTKPDLTVIQAKEGDQGLPYEFSLSVTLAKPGDPVPPSVVAPIPGEATVPAPAVVTPMPATPGSTPPVAPPVAPAPAPPTQPQPQAPVAAPTQEGNR